MWILGRCLASLRPVRLSQLPKWKPRGAGSRKPRGDRDVDLGSDHPPHQLAHVRASTPPASSASVAPQSSHDTVLARACRRAGGSSHGSAPNDPKNKASGRLLFLTTYIVTSIMSIEEITDEVQDLQVDNEADVAAVEGGDITIPASVQNRGERKSRKSLQGIGLKKVSGITRVTMKRPRGHLYVVQQPEVYKSSQSDCYIVFGEAKPEDMSAAAQAQAAQAQMAQQEAQERMLSEQFANSMAQGGESAQGKKKEAEEEEEEDESEPIDEEGVDAKDIELVMQQVSCSRRKAVKALKESNGDLINAIMSAS
ncbi:unnamed protein product [Jaminaea pallidilutea]